MRPSERRADELRQVRFTRRFTRHAEGAVLVEFGETKVICTASVVESQPSHLRDTPRGWVTAEYGMLPRSTHTRTDREAARGRQSGRTLEIQRLIGRSLRAVVNLEGLGPRTIYVDCDVMQADGGTRTASITGAFLAMRDAVEGLLKRGLVKAWPILDHVAAVSVGLYRGVPILDLDYLEDSQCETDMNVVMTGTGGLVELQGTAERNSFSRQDLTQMLDLAGAGIARLVDLQRQALADTGERGAEIPGKG